MKSTVLFAILFATIFATAVTADISETTVGLSLSELLGERAIGFNAATPFETGRIKGEATAQGLSTGGIIKGNYHVEAGVEVNGWDVLAFTDSEVKGYELNNLNPKSKLGMALEAPDQKIGQFDISFKIGVFGQDGGVFANQNALKILEEAGVNIDKLDPSLGKVFPDPIGIPYINKNTLNNLFELELSHPSNVKSEIQFMPELLGKGNKAHQGKVILHLNRKFGKHLNWRFTGEFAALWYKGSTHTETAFSQSINIVL